MNKFLQGFIVGLAAATIFYIAAKPVTEEDINAYNQRMLADISIRNTSDIAMQLVGKASFIKVNGKAYIVDDMGRRPIFILKDRTAYLGGVVR